MPGQTRRRTAVALAAAATFLLLISLVAKDFVMLPSFFLGVSHTTKKQQNSLITQQDDHHQSEDARFVTTILGNNDTVVIGRVRRLCRHEKYCERDNDNETRKAHTSPSCEWRNQCELLTRQPLSSSSCNENINGPVVIRCNHHSKCPAPYLLYVSFHTSVADIQLFVADSMLGPWNPVSIHLANTGCRGKLHSPDVITLDDDDQRILMYVHGHECRNKPIGSANQISSVLSSTDWIHWVIPDEATNNNTMSSLPSSAMVSSQLFYLRTFVYQGTYYGIAKSQENCNGSAILSRSDNRGPLGTFEPIRALSKQGVRHTSLYVKKDILFVFYSMIGGKPESIRLGHIDLSLSNNEHNWTFTPGPVVLAPIHDYEHGNHSVTNSRCGAAPPCGARELRDPYFVANDNETDERLSGVLYYTVRGESGIAAALVDINITKLLPKTDFAATNAH